MLISSYQVTSYVPRTSGLRYIVEERNRYNQIHKNKIKITKYRKIRLKPIKEQNKNWSEFLRYHLGTLTSHSVLLSDFPDILSEN